MTTHIRARWRAETVQLGRGEAPWGDVVAEGAAALPTPILQVGNRRCQAWVSLRAAMCVKRKPTTTARKGGDCNVQCCPAQARQPQSTENPFVWWRTQSVAAVVAVLAVAMANRTRRYASQWRRCARDEHSVFGTNL